MKKAFLNDLGIAYKLILLNVLLIVAAILASSQLSYSISRQELREKIDQVHASALNQASYTLSSRLRMMEHAGNIVLFDPEVRGFLTSDIANKSRLEQLQYQRSLTAKLSNFEAVYEFLRVRLYVDNEAFFANERVNFFPLSDLNENVHASSATTSDVWFIDENPGFLRTETLGEGATVSLVKVIRYTKDIRSIIGAVRVDIARREVVDRLQTLQLTESTQVILADDSSGHSIALAHSPELQMAYSKAPQRFATDTHDSSAMEGYSVFTSSLDGPQWRIVMAVSDRQLNVPLTSIRSKIILVMIAVGCVTILLSFIIGNSITGRINRIAHAMGHIHQGDMTQRLSKDGNDEIGQLQDDFNYMSDTIDRLLLEQYKLGRDLKDAELMALQSQINPHFLYNTLDLINWISIQHNAEEISDIVDELSRFYRISLSHGKDIVTIETELEHVKLYLKIQNRRYNNNIAFHFKVDETIRLYQIPKLTLQPLVENAIVHGIMEKPEKAGQITITGVLSNSTVHLTVADDGVGISGNSVDSLLTGCADKQQNGYGVYNIHQRLKTKFGESSGLIYSNRPGGGTTVVVSLPAVVMKCEQHA